MIGDFQSKYFCVQSNWPEGPHHHTFSEELIHFVHLISKTKLSNAINVTCYVLKTELDTILICSLPFQFFLKSAKFQFVNGDFAKSEISAPHKLVK